MPAFKFKHISNDVISRVRDQAEDGKFESIKLLIEIEKAEQLGNVAVQLDRLGFNDCATGTPFDVPGTFEDIGISLRQISEVLQMLHQPK